MRAFMYLYHSAFKKKNRAWLFFLVALSYQGLRSVRGSDSPTRTPQELQWIQFESCYDGDTCTGSNAEGLHLKMRLVGIDAPERAPRSRRQQRKKPGQAYAQEARQALVERVVSKKLPVEILGRDIYHRYLVLIYTDAERKESINAWLVREGFAYAYRGAHAKDHGLQKTFLEYEAEAQKKVRGFWALPKQQRPENPSTYRHRH